MQLLSTFFPRRRRPRTVVHAGPLVLRRAGGVGALRRYLSTPRRREVILVHQGQEPLREVARAAGVKDIALDSSAKREATDTSEVTLALGARRLDFTIDERGVSDPNGETLREIPIKQAEALAHSPAVRPKIRAKLRAAAAALRCGVARVRIGDPSSLATGRATIVVPDSSIPLEATEHSSRDPDALSAPAEPLRDPWWRLRGRGRSVSSPLRAA